jgi:hypothetical protein
LIEGQRWGLGVGWVGGQAAVDEFEQQLAAASHS